MDRDDRAFYGRRAVIELERARRATSVEAQAVHLALAQAYERLSLAQVTAWHR